MKYITFGILFALTIISLGSRANAQLLGTTDPVSISLKPAFPQPGASVSAEVVSSSLDLTRSYISWELDGENLAEGGGVLRVSFVAGSLGSVSRLSVFVTPPKGGVIAREVVIRPSEVNLVVEADSYTPPLYRGRALASSDTPVKIVAIPDLFLGGRQLHSDELIYTWKKDGKIISAASGRGRDSFQTIAPRLSNETTIRVDVESADGSVKSEGAIRFSTTPPQVLFYEDDPLLGIRYERPVRGIFRLLRDELTILAHPFFFSGNQRVNGGFQFLWRLNGSPIEADSFDSSRITLRQIAPGSGESDLSLEIRNKKQILQGAKENVRIQFGAVENALPIF